MKIRELPGDERNQIYRICGALVLHSINDDSELYEFTAEVLDRVKIMRRTMRDIKELVKSAG